MIPDSPALLTIRSALVLLLAVTVAWRVYRAHDPGKPTLVHPVAVAVFIGLLAAGTFNSLIGTQ